MEAVSLHEPRCGGVTVLVGFTQHIAGCRGDGESQQRYFTSRSVRAHSLFKRGKCVANFAIGNRGTSAHYGNKRLHRFVLKGVEASARMPMELTGFVVKNERSAELRINKQLHEIANDGLGARNRVQTWYMVDSLAVFRLEVKFVLELLDRGVGLLVDNFGTLIEYELAGCVVEDPLFVPGAGEDVFHKMTNFRRGGKHRVDNMTSHFELLWVRG